MLFELKDAMDAEQVFHSHHQSESTVGSVSWEVAAWTVLDITKATIDTDNQQLQMNIRLITARSVSADMFLSVDVMRND